MAPKIFATGITGYVGGDILSTLLSAYPTWESNITCLVRSSFRGASLSSTYPQIKVVYGSLEDANKIEEEASNADIVLHFASSDHVGAAEAIKRGLEKGKGGYWIHTSGTDILCNPKLLKGERDSSVGEVKVYDDWEGIGELISFPDAHSHRPCDKVVLSATSLKVKTAIICPPTIWGPGHGPASTRSHQIYELARLTLEHKSGIQLLPLHSGKTFWPNINIRDLSRLYLHIINAATIELSGGQSNATWDNEGYYFAENGVHYWQDVAGWIAEEAKKQGFLEREGVPEEAIDHAELLKATGPAVFNTGASCKSHRAEKLFGWKPEGPQLRDEIERVVRSEAERAGLVK